MDSNQEYIRRKTSIGTFESDSRIKNYKNIVMPIKRNVATNPATKENSDHGKSPPKDLSKS